MMQIVEIDTDDFIGLRCPNSGSRWVFEAGIDEQGFMSESQLLGHTFVRGIVADEVPDSMASQDATLAEAWSATWLEAWEKAEDEDDYCDLREVLATFEHDGLLALELTKQRVKHRPVGR